MLTFLLEYILLRGFKPQYYGLVWLGEKGVHQRNIVPQNVYEEEGFTHTMDIYDRYETEGEDVNVNEDADLVDEIMERSRMS